MEIAEMKEKLKLVARHSDFEVISSGAIWNHFGHKSDADVTRLLEPDYWDAITDLGLRPGDRITVSAKSEPWGKPWVELVISGLIGQHKVPSVRLLSVATPKS